MLVQLAGDAGIMMMMMMMTFIFYGTVTKLKIFENRYSPRMVDTIRQTK